MGLGSCGLVECTSRVNTKGSFFFQNIFKISFNNKKITKLAYIIIIHVQVIVIGKL